MHIAPRLLARALDRARAEWLAGDPDAWARYTAGLARLEQHYVRDDAAAPARSASRATLARGDDRPPQRP